VAERDVILYDTTLRDGEQTPAVAFTRFQRVEIARALDSLGISQIEIGFAASGPLHQEDMQAIVQAGLAAQLLSLARPLSEDIDAAREVGVGGVLLFISTSDIHMQHKLRIGFDEVLDRVRTSIAYAREAGLWVQMTMEDATRTPLDRIAAFSAVAAEAGADRVGMADTVGCATPQQFRDMVGVVRGVTDVPVAVHCHDDFGLATANSIAAVEAGAVAVSATINGLGERAGNAAMEECALALERLYGRHTGLDLSRFAEVSRLVAAHSGVAVPPNKGVVGRNCFRHESGIHIAAVLRDPACYEPYPPEVVGAERTLELGKTSGRTAVRHLAGAAGEGLDDAACQRILDHVKTLCEEGGTLDPETLEMLVQKCSP
jgi:isopropylmalate/homocitrate/citramalate synthase